jgi:hypothetical protein
MIESYDHNIVSTSHWTEGVCQIEFQHEMDWNQYLPEMSMSEMTQFA